VVQLSWRGKPGSGQEIVLHLCRSESNLIQKILCWLAFVNHLLLNG
jgi:hypothetical protein